MLSEANKLKGGEELLLSDFGNSTETPFSILRSNGFQVKEKQEMSTFESFFSPLIKFLKQSDTENLKTASYPSEFRNLKVKVSFGIGNTAHIPWISFLGEGQTTSKGIYPVYLNFKKHDLLILAYGISETHTPHINWALSEKKTIKEYFNENNLGSPYRYGSSYIHTVYDTNSDLQASSVNKDLNNLVTYYKNFLGTTDRESANQETDLITFSDDIEKANLNYSNTLCKRFICALCTKPFLILTGLSGSGKTKIAQAFSKWITHSQEQINIVPIGADWTNREPLLGYPNALEHKGYVKPDSGVLEFILKADENKDKPFFLILDEMNLSHVERYFADFLSAMESGDSIKLHSGNGERWNGIPSRIKIPSNLFVIGTVNIDETTYMFSPKVLDRANVIEFRVTSDELTSYLENPQNINLTAIEGEGVGAADDFLSIATQEHGGFSHERILNVELIKFFKALKEVGAEFGYRSAYEIHRFANISTTIPTEWTAEEIIDITIAQKLLPKLHGSRRKLVPILEALAELCTLDREKTDSLLSEPTDEKIKDPSIVKYPISFEKIARMYKRLLENGFTSFAEG